MTTSRRLLPVALRARVPNVARASYRGWLASAREWHMSPVHLRVVANIALVELVAYPPMATHHVEHETTSTSDVAPPDAGTPGTAIIGPHVPPACVATNARIRGKVPLETACAMRVA